jgi:2-keto-4-pentenoate hydratase
MKSLLLFRSASTVNYDDVAYHFAAAKSLQSIVPKSTLDQLVNASDVDAYKVHDAFITNQTELLGNIIGWKVGATNDKARKALGFGPFYGPLFSKSCVQSESSISLRTWGRTLIAVEAELAVIMKANLTSTSADEAFKPDQVWECVGILN